MGNRGARDNLYDCNFYAKQARASLESARVVARLVTELLKPDKVVDIGCGLGTWLRAFRENGARSLRGFDGDHIDRSRFFIDGSDFVAVDLSKPFEIDGRYDLSICVEVAEHLPGSISRHLIDLLTHAAPVVLFSAALPGQGGTGHVNEQWPEYWRELFDSRGFRMVDAIRPRIRDDARIRWWYRQNLVLFAHDMALAAHPELRTANGAPGNAIEWVHVNMLREAGLRNLMCHLRPALLKALRDRIHRTM
jgi:SAM-dependent methyltransferase